LTERPKSSHEPASAEEPIICVIDDDVAVRTTLSSLFRSVGLRVELFGSVHEFKQIKTPDVASCLVLDIRLPGVSGLDLQAELAEADIRISIIFITGHGDIPMSVKAMKAGAMDFLTKPFRDQDILDAVTSCGDRQAARFPLRHPARARFCGRDSISPRNRLISLNLRRTAGISDVYSGCLVRDEGCPLRATGRNSATMPLSVKS
jgi:FixJ family two-component response regulator